MVSIELYLRCVDCPRREPESAMRYEGEPGNMDGPYCPSCAKKRGIP